MDYLLAWAKKYGTQVENVSIEHNPKSGYFFQASDDIKPHSSIVDCSYQTMLSYLDVALGITRSREPFPMSLGEGEEAVKPHIIGHFFLMQQYLLKSKSFWYPYIKLLPQPDEPEKLGIPILWPEEDQKFFVGTNLEPSIRIKAQMWMNDWIDGTAHIQDPREKNKYTYQLYQWAAFIFGSRSFRASLTIPEEQIMNSNLSPREKGLLLQRVREDQFSVLLPVLDLGNHNGVNGVEWYHNEGKRAFTLSNLNLIPKGSEVYNYYGDKPNNELLLGYGFVLPDAKHDVVNLKVTPSPPARTLRRAQACHRCPKLGQEEEEWVYPVRQISSDEDPGRALVIGAISHGLLDTLACMVATPREQKVLAALHNSCYESKFLETPAFLPRIRVQILLILNKKVDHEYARVGHYGSHLRPENENQRTAIEYRETQRKILLGALRPLIHLLAEERNKDYSSAHVRGTGFYYTATLEQAWTSLQSKYADIWQGVTRYIAEDQEEDLPIVWSVLIEDWNHTYWVVWVFLLMALRENDKKKFKRQSSIWDEWLSNMKFNESNNTLYAETSEATTIWDTCEMVMELPQFSNVRFAWSKEKRLQYIKFASYVVAQSCLHSADFGTPEDYLCIDTAGLPGANGELGAIMKPGSVEGLWTRIVPLED